MSIQRGLIPTGSVASLQAMMLAGAIFSITKKAKTLSTTIEDDSPKESFIFKIKETDDDILNYLEDLHSPDPLPYMKMLALMALVSLISSKT